MCRGRYCPCLLQTACASITAQYATIFSGRCVPLTLGGDHLITYPILRAAAATHGPLAVRGVHLYFLWKIYI